MKVALVVMPFADSDRPSLAVGLLQAGLEQRGINCDSKYFNVTLRKMLGRESFDFLAQEASMIALAGEWAFSQVFFGRSPAVDGDYRREVLEDPVWGIPKDKHRHVEALLSVVPLFLRVVFESNDWSQYDLVGFTSTFEQTMPSFALARMIRKKHPEVLLAAGGANFEAGMGRPYMENFEFLDFVSTGEADLSFPELCCNLRDVNSGRIDHLEVPPGFLFREGGEVRESAARSDGFVDLDQLATPSYDDFFRVRGSNGRVGDTAPWIPVEAARGCWWGAKAHCTFCGLNGESMKFRRKSSQRVIDEIDELENRYGHVGLQFADNILGMDYFRDLLPFWATRGNTLPKFFEIKSNLNREQVLLLGKAGVTLVQAGVESLADGTLRLMRKGVSGAQNVALLRWCVEAGIRPMWNILYGFPGESLDDYERTLGVLRWMTHLPPPDVIAPIRMDRFSPNHSSWRELGFTEVTPAPAYRYVYPFSEQTLEQLAYYFAYQHPQMEAAAAAASGLHGLAREWMEKCQSGDNGNLSVEPADGSGFDLIDSRFNASSASGRLTELELALLLACDAPATHSAALRSAGKMLAAGSVPSEALERTLSQLIDRGIIALAGQRLVTLALLPERSDLRRSLMQ